VGLGLSCILLVEGYFEERSRGGNAGHVKGASETQGTLHRASRWKRRRHRCGGVGFVVLYTTV
jgi:hypothetical protein